MHLEALVQLAEAYAAACRCYAAGHVSALTTDSIVTWTLACRYYSVAKLPHDFLTGDRLLQADYYRLLCEPIDIANYYRPWDADGCAFRDA